MFHTDYCTDVQMHHQEICQCKNSVKSLVRHPALYVLNKLPIQDPLLLYYINGWSFHTITFLLYIYYCSRNYYYFTFNDLYI